MNTRHTVFEYDQVITEQDLLTFERALTQQYRDTPWYRFATRWATGIAAGVIMGLAAWIREGKGTIKREK